MPGPAKQPFRRGEHAPLSQQPTVMIGEDVISRSTIPSGNVYPLFRLLLPTMYTRTPTPPPGSVRAGKADWAGMRAGASAVTPPPPYVPTYREGVRVAGR